MRNSENHMDNMALIANALTIILWAILFLHIGVSQQKLFNFLVGSFLVSGAAIHLLFTNPVLQAVGVALQLIGSVLACIQYYFFFKHK